MVNYILVAHMWQCSRWQFSNAMGCEIRRKHRSMDTGNNQLLYLPLLFQRLSVCLFLSVYLYKIPLSLFIHHSSFILSYLFSLFNDMSLLVSNTNSCIFIVENYSDLLAGYLWLGFVLICVQQFRQVCKKLSAYCLQTIFEVWNSTLRSVFAPKLTWYKSI